MTLGTFAFILADARARTGRSRRSPICAGLSSTNPVHGADPDDADVLAGRHSAARRLLRQVVRLPRRHRGAVSTRLPIIGVLASRGRRLLLSAHHQDHVVRRTGRQASCRWQANSSSCSASAGCFRAVLPLFAGSLVDATTTAAASLLLMPWRTRTSARIPHHEAGRYGFDQCRCAGGSAGRRSIRPVDHGAPPKRRAGAAAGRDWVSQEGNLYRIAAAARPRARSVSLPTLPFVASLAVHEALAGSAATPGHAPHHSLKWPNDVLVYGAQGQRHPAGEPRGGRRADRVSSASASTAPAIHPRRCTAATDLASCGINASA